MSCDCECKTTLPVGRQGSVGATGPQGIQGIQGVAGDSSYVYQGWAIDSSGTGFTEDPNALTLDHTYTAFLISTTEIPFRTGASYTGLWALFSSGVNTYYVPAVANLSAITSPSEGDLCYITATREWWRWRPTVNWLRIHANGWTQAAISVASWTGAITTESCNLNNVVFRYKIDADTVFFTLEIPLIVFGGTTNIFNVNLAASVAAIASALPQRNTFSFNALYNDASNSTSFALVWGVSTAGMLSIFRSSQVPNFAATANSSIFIEGFYERDV